MSGTESKVSSSPLLLKQCEAIIDDELENLQKLFKALEVIEEMRLYESVCNDFESYCKRRWKTIDRLTEEGRFCINPIIKKEK